MKNHYRSNFSCFHVIDYDENNGHVIKKQTYQGLNDQSSWARGQAWGFYGYVMLYRETRIDRYLIFAERIASYILDNLPINMSGGKFTKINPDFCGPGASEFLRQHDYTGGGSETEMLSSAS